MSFPLRAISRTSFLLPGSSKRTIFRQGRRRTTSSTALSACFSRKWDSMELPLPTFLEAFSTGKNFEGITGLKEILFSSIFSKQWQLRKLMKEVLELSFFSPSLLKYCNTRWTIARTARQKKSPILKILCSMMKAERPSPMDAEECFNKSPKQVSISPGLT